MFKKKGADGDSVPFLTATAIIICFLSVFAPFIIVIVFHDVFYFQLKHNSLIFQAPVSSYVLCGVSIFYIGLVIGILAYFQSQNKGRVLLKSSVTAMAMIPAFLAIYLSLNHYYYLTEKGIYHNHLFAWEETLYQWEDIEQAVAVSSYNENNSEVTLSELQFTTQSGHVLSYRYNQELIRSQQAIRHVLESHNIELQQSLKGEED